MFEKLAALLKEATISVMYNRREIKKILPPFPQSHGHLCAMLAIRY